MPHEVRTHDSITETIAFLRESATLEEAARALAERDVGAVLVGNDENHVTAILTDRDIVVLAIAKGKDPHTTTVGEIATYDPICVAPDAPLMTVAEVMAQHRVRRLP